MDCIKCGHPITPSGSGSYDYFSSYCENCEEVSVERYRQRQEWRLYHDEPCPEEELTQFPKLVGWTSGTY